jgi:hypothetical protein
MPRLKTDLPHAGAAPAVMNPSRRMLFGGARAMLLAAAAPPAAAGAPPPATGDDAELVRLCAEHDALERRYLGLYDGPDAIEDEDERDRAADPVRLQQSPLMERIMAAQPATTAGHRARARTLAYWAPDLLEPGQTETGDDPEQLLAIIIIDLLDGELPVTRKGNKLVVTDPAVIGAGGVS